MTNWPGYMREYQRAVRTLEPADFDLVPMPAAAKDLSSVR